MTLFGSYRSGCLIRQPFGWAKKGKISGDIERSREIEGDTLRSLEVARNESPTPEVDYTTWNHEKSIKWYRFMDATKNGNIG
jgi:hypothetical protein